MVDPVRIQLSRRKGWRMPENTVKVTRPGKWGNPFKIGSIDRRTGGTLDADTAVDRYLAWLFRQPHGTDETIDAELRGKNLACWCKIGEPCHADALLEMANGPICEEVR